MRALYVAALLIFGVLVCTAQDVFHPFQGAQDVHKDCPETGEATWSGCDNGVYTEDECLERCYLLDFEADIKSSCYGRPPFCTNTEETCHVQIKIHTSPCHPCEHDTEEEMDLDAHDHPHEGCVEKDCEFAQYSIRMGPPCIKPDCIYGECQDNEFSVCFEIDHEEEGEEHLWRLKVETGHHRDTTLDLWFNKWWKHFNWPHNDFFAEHLTTDEGEHPPKFKAMCPFCENACSSDAESASENALDGIDVNPESRHTWLEYILTRPPVEIDCRRLESLGCEHEIV